MIKKIDKQEYLIIKSWWKEYGRKHGLEIIPESVLPEGYVVYRGDMPAIATWVYHTDVIAWLAWTTANPSLKDRDDLFDELFNGVGSILKDRGISLLFAGANNDSLIKRFTNNGFIKLEENNVHLIKPLGG